MLTMDGAPVPKKARVKQEFDTRVISFSDPVQSPFEEQNEADCSPDTEGGDSSSEQFEPIEVPIEYAEETFPVNLIEEKLETEETVKHSNTRFILCQPNESFETVKNSWTQSMTYILIEEYRKLLSNFQDPHMKQKDSWVKVAENMSHRGCDVTWDMCDQKWRNLKHTFKSIYYNKHRSEKSKRRWDFYELLEDLFGSQLEAEDSKKAAHISSTFTSHGISSKTEPVTSKRHKLRVDPVNYQLPVNYSTETRAFDLYEREIQNKEKQTDSRNNAKDSIPPLWFQEFMKEYRETEDQRLALVREMHNDILQVERRKVAALEGLLMKFLG